MTRAARLDLVDQVYSIAVDQSRSELPSVGGQFVPTAYGRNDGNRRRLSEGTSSTPPHGAITRTDPSCQFSSVGRVTRLTSKDAALHHDPSRVIALASGPTDAAPMNFDRPSCCQRAGRGC